MNSKNKFLLISILCILMFFSFFLFKKDVPEISNITISYADSLVTPFNIAENEYGLVDLNSLPSNFAVELRYASKNNFAQKEFYPKIAKAYLQESTAEKLVKANEELYSMGYRIKIFDAYRPHRYQYMLREEAKNINPLTANYIADPKTGSNHNRGASVDITLTDLNGKELPMPTDFDFFGKEASIKYNNCTAEQKNNRELLGKIMEKHGFRRIESEWWHFDDTDSTDYPILDVDFLELYN